MHIYWASVFILPSRIVHDLEQLMRGFLWCQGEMKKGKAKMLGIPVAMQACAIVVGPPRYRCGPLKDLLFNRDIVRSGFSLENSVWSKVRVLCGMDAIPPYLRRLPPPGQMVDDILSYIDEVGYFQVHEMSYKSRLLFLTNGRFQAIVLSMMGVPGEGCTLFALSKVFSSGFSLERFFMEVALLGSQLHLSVAAGFCSDARLIICFSSGLCLF
ncbi:hypothetical protein Tco_0714480 [Tanacetum coccineum]